MKIQIQEEEQFLLIKRIISHSIIVIEVIARNCLNLFIHINNFEELKNKINKKARNYFDRMRKLP
jgi:hypothetical protein